jgi:hypothetical protein
MAKKAHVPAPKPQKKANEKNPKDHNGRTEKAVKSYHQGALPKNEHDVAARNTSAKFGTTGKGPKKITKIRGK